MDFAFYFSVDIPIIVILILIFLPIIRRLPDRKGQIVVCEINIQNIVASEW